MLEREIEIINKLGLHARASAKLVQTASRYGSQVLIEKTGQVVNGKSIMGVMMLAAGKGSYLILRTEGEDEADCLAALVELIENRFEEAE